MIPSINYLHPRYLELADQIENNVLRNVAHLEELTKTFPPGDGFKWTIDKSGRPRIKVSDA